MNREDPKTNMIERRDLLRLGGAAAAGLLTAGLAPAAPAEPRPLPPLPVNPHAPATRPTRNLGRTGYATGLFSLGGQAAIEQPRNEAVAVPLIERALDLGVNYIDTSARYGGERDRWSEVYIGQVMKRRRGEVFLASKTHDRTRDGSLKLLQRSLDLLHTDHLDLWQLHNLDSFDDVEQIFAKGGALEALTQARDQKLVRFLGVTGHADPAVLLEAIRRFPFDTLLLALNAADRFRLPFGERLLPLAVEREMGVIGMKIPARGRLLSMWKPGAEDRHGATSAGTLSMREAMRYVLSLPVSTVIVGCDSIAQLEENVRLASEFTPLSPGQMAELEARARPVHAQALFFRRQA
jgi:aryl-alcohol dehydrogenase-like predicted oxidoreductase